jgi:hypothetical protein
LHTAPRFDVSTLRAAGEIRLFQRIRLDADEFKNRNRTR